jgi:hypothetical protein
VEGLGSDTGEVAVEALPGVGAGESEVVVDTGEVVVAETPGAGAGRASTATSPVSDPSPSTWLPAPPQLQNPALEPHVHGLKAWIHQIQPVLMFSILMIALSVTVCVSQIGGSLACHHLAAVCLPRLPPTNASSTTRPVAAAPLSSLA